MVRACDGSTLPKGVPGKTYLLREKGTQGHEVFDVTDPSNPVLVSTPVDNLRDAHKSWWECDTGIAYLVSDGRPDGWRVSRMTKVFDLSDPANPVFLRNFGLVGQRSEEHTSELQSLAYLVCRLLLEKKKTSRKTITN